MPGYTHFKMPGYTHYTDFLKDRKFIRWQLLPDEELDTYWREFIEKNLHLNDILREAIEYMKTTGLNNSSLSASERLHLLKRIETSIEQSEKKVKIDRTVLLYLSSCAAIALVIFGLTFFIQQQKKTTLRREKYSWLEAC
jgi:transmembrane sensor